MARLSVALAATGAEGAVVSERVIANAAEAAAAGMNGSPTILVDGVDLFAVEPAEPSVSCRLYPSQDGFEGAPTVDALIAALTKAGSSPACVISEASGGDLPIGPGVSATGHQLGMDGFARMGGDHH
jgi:hypothetical protein